MGDTTAAEVPGRGFGALAEQYDRARPTYPPELVADLLRDSPAEVLDVGCGTGKAARLFAGDGRRVLGVEPDARMAAVARGRGIEVEVAPFETWDDAGRQFELLISGQAWHWVDPTLGAEKAARVLKPGGLFAAFWNAEEHTAEMLAVWADVYGAHAPELLTTSFALGVRETIDAEHDLEGASLAAGPFTDVVAGQRKKYHWTVEYTPRQWVDHVATASDHVTLDPAVRAPLLTALEQALGKLGPHFTVPYTTDLLSAVRR